MTDYKEITEALDKSGQWQITDYIIAATFAKRDVPLLLARNAELETSLLDAIDCVQSWSAYASDYFKDKHDLDGDLVRLRKALEKS